MRMLMISISIFLAIIGAHAAAGQTTIDMPPPPSAQPARPVDAAESIVEPRAVEIAVPPMLAGPSPTAQPIPVTTGHQQPAKASRAELAAGRLALRRYAMARTGTRDTYYFGDDSRYASYGRYSYLNFGWPTWGVWHGHPFFIGGFGFIGKHHHHHHCGDGKGMMADY